MMEKPELPSRGDLFRTADPLIEWTDRAIHVFVGVLFLVAAVWIGIYAVKTFLHELSSGSDDFLVEAIDLINSLLLVLIILEVLGTVRSYLQEGHTSLKPFLVIGIISATRRILAVGAESGVAKNFSSETTFQHLMIDLGVNAAVVLALALALWFFARAQRDDAAGLDSTEELRRRALKG
jgi:uncharacterized membrane protein (DUF373 family)